jgi:Leucine-rich repeat (LRR) protein
MSYFLQIIGNLKQLMFLDASKNRLEFVAEQICECLSLADLHLSNNQLQHLPESLGK